MIPRQITWEDGTKYEIDRVLDIRQAAAMKAGGRVIGILFESADNRAIFSLNAVRTYLAAILVDGLLSGSYNF